MVSFIFARKTLFLSALLILIAIFLRLLTSYYSISNLPPSTDEAVSAMMAHGISSGEHFPLLTTAQPYQFPVEAYLMSPIVDYLPHNAMGARIPTLLLNLLTVLILLRLAIKIFPKGQRWVSLSLILIPSAYWLIHQSGYPIIQYPITGVFAALLFTLAYNISKSPRLLSVQTFLAGLIAGIAISNHLLIASVVVAAFIIIIFSASSKHIVKRLLLLSCGLLIGLIPFILALTTLHEAYSKVSNPLPFHLVIERLWGMVLKGAIPGAFGVNPPYFGDFPTRIDWGEMPRQIMTALFSALILLITASRLIKLFSHIKSKSGLHFQWSDMFLGASLLSIYLMASNGHGSSGDHRYLMAVIWSFPFLMGYLYQNRLLKPIIAGLTIAFLLFNLISSISLLKEWRTPEKIQHHSDTPDITPLLAWMQKNDFKYCYATFWLTYRVSYESDGDAICAPVYNERFNGWPIPYKDEVNLQNSAIYVLSNTVGSKYHSRKFEWVMDKYKVKYQRHKIGDLFIYYNFQYKLSKNQRALSKNRYALNSNLPHNQSISMLGDIDIETAWQNSQVQKQGQFIEASLDAGTHINSISLFYPVKKPYTAKALTISGFKDDQWEILAENVPTKIERMRFSHQHPILGEYHQTIRFDAGNYEKLRVEISHPAKNKVWALSEVMIGETTQTK